ncbi:hypothetical protein MN032_01510 [Agromyces atrinae]|uniref:hypothetical protein n=1 Tax=Agromyces atrinae TaxID=592376 RepID=UPI001F5AE51E|nr:hypothetical protein [Agromyces atrinae]MCI2956354.1 hypothetical protein [Agromyces atrinae]
MEDMGVCIVAPPTTGVQGEGCTLRQQEWITTLRRLAEIDGHEVKVFRTVPRTSQRNDESGRRLFMLDPWEAERLYKLIHRGHFAVFQAGQARVQLDPLKPLSSVNTIALARLVRYKAYFAQFDGSTAPADWLAEFVAWANETHVDTHRDCRVLPLHMFAPHRDWPDLAPPTGRDEFALAHGGPSHLSDEESRAWKQPNAMHGQEALLVANHVLPSGFHWDVNAAATPSRLASLIERWKFDKGAYANVSPDGHIRGGQGSGVSASREGTAARPPEPEPARASKPATRTRRRRSGRGR